MKKHYLTIMKGAFMALFFINTSLLTAQTYVPQPYYTGFESGALGTEWSTSSSTPNGEVSVFGQLTWNTQVANPDEGTYFMGMHNAQPAGGFNLNTADLHLDLAGESGLVFSFSWTEWNDETHIEDGVYISDDGGTSFTKVLDLNGDSYTDLQWNYFNFNLDSINSANGLTYTNNYIIRFQQYDDYYFAGGNDGFLIDEVNVFLPCNSFSSLTETDCESYTVPSGDETYTASGVYYDTLPNAAGCDSIITIDLTINNTTSSITESACDTYTVPSGDETYSSSGNYNDTIPNAVGCDSIITIDLTINESLSTTEDVTACGSYEWTDGTVYSSSGVYTQNLQTIGGCDSIATLDLTINDNPNMSISSTDNVELTAVGTADSIEWINCNDSTIELIDETIFTPSVNGNYAVVGINQNGCTDTSECFMVSTVSLDELNIQNVIIYPNPAEKEITIKAQFEIAKVKIIDLSGKTVLTSEQNIVRVSELSKGAYIAKIYDVNGDTVIKEFIKK